MILLALAAAAQVPEMPAKYVRCFGTIALTKADCVKNKLLTEDSTKEHINRICGTEDYWWDAGWHQPMTPDRYRRSQRAAKCRKSYRGFYAHWYPEDVK